MKIFVLPALLALGLGIPGTAWAGCGAHAEKTPTTAEAPVETPAEPAPSS